MWELANTLADCNLRKITYMINKMDLNENKSKGKRFSTDRNYWNGNTTDSGMNSTSEINVWMFWIVLIWSGGTFKYEASRLNCPFSGTKEELEASLLRTCAVPCSSMFELSSVAFVSFSWTKLSMSKSKRMSNHRMTTTYKLKQWISNNH